MLDFLGFAIPFVLGVIFGAAVMYFGGVIIDKVNGED